MGFLTRIYISRSGAQSAVGPKAGIRNSPPRPERQGTGSAANTQQVTSCMCQALCKGASVHSTDMREILYYRPILQMRRLTCSRSRS